MNSHGDKGEKTSRTADDALSISSTSGSDSHTHHRQHRDHLEESKSASGQPLRVVAPASGPVDSASPPSHDASATHQPGSSQPANPICDHGHTWRFHWHRRGSGCASKSLASSSGVTNNEDTDERSAMVCRNRVQTFHTISSYASLRSRVRAVAELERQLVEGEAVQGIAHEGDEVNSPIGGRALHHRLRDWYSTFLRSWHTRHANEVLVASVPTSDSELSEEMKRQSVVDAAARRATGHTRSGGSTASNSNSSSLSTSFAGPSKANLQGGRSLLRAWGGASASERPFMAPLQLVQETRTMGPHQNSTTSSAMGESALPLTKAGNRHDNANNLPTISSASASFLQSETSEAAALGGEPAGQQIVQEKLFAPVVSSFQNALLATSYKQMVGLWLCMLMVLSGNALQVIALNFWIRQFPAKGGGAGNYTTLAVSSMMFSAFFLVLLTIYLIVERPNLRFLRHTHGARLLLCVGGADLACSCLTIYAASHTSEVLQALFTSTAPIFTAFFQKKILRDPRQYCNVWVMVAFACIVVGVLLASSYGFLHPLLLSWGLEQKHTPAAAFAPTASDAAFPQGDNEDGLPHWKKVTWSILFFSSVIPSAIQNVVQTKYMLYFTKDPLFERWAINRVAESHGEDFLDNLGTLTQDKRVSHVAESNCHACGRNCSHSDVPATGVKEIHATTVPNPELHCEIHEGYHRHPSSSWILKKRNCSADSGLQPAVGNGDFSSVHIVRPLPSVNDFHNCPKGNSEGPQNRSTFTNASTAEARHPLHQHRDHHHSHHPHHHHYQPGVDEDSETLSYGTFSGGANCSFGKHGIPDTPTWPLNSVDSAGQSSRPLADAVSKPNLSVMDDESTYSVSCECTRIRMCYGRVAPGEDLTVKLVLLAAETTIQAVGALLLLPMDALPFWGNSKNVREAARNYEQGLSCVLHCKHNMAFGFLYCLGFVFMYIGVVYLDQFSVTFCSMVTQLAAPCTALLLIFYPSLNLTGDYTPWWLSCIAIAFLAMGTILFTSWDQKTTDEKMEGENEVKRDYVEPYIVVERDGEVKEYPA